MAFQKLLNGAWTGSVGDLTGSRQKQRNIVKSKINSKAPMTVIQRKNVRSFEKLNRFASGLCSAFKQELGLISNKMYPHNVLTQRLKSMIAKKVFDPWAYQRFYGSSKGVRIEALNYNSTTQIIKIKLKYSNIAEYPSDVKMNIVFFDNTGLVDYAKLESGKQTELTYNKVLQIYRGLYLAIRFYRIVNKKIIELGVCQMNLQAENYSLEAVQTEALWVDGRRIWQQTFYAQGVVISGFPHHQVASPPANITYIKGVISNVLMNEGSFVGGSMDSSDGFAHYGLVYHPNGVLHISNNKYSPAVFTGYYTIWWTDPAEAPVN